MSSPDYNTIASIVEESRDYAIDVLKNIVPADAISPENGGKGEWGKAEVVLKYLREAGVNKIEVVEAPDSRADRKSRPNIIARIKGKDESKNVWIMTHLDVVPAGDEKQWKFPPWEATVEGDKVYGRGSEDNGQGITSCLVVANAINKAGIRPRYNLNLLFVADEEVGSQYGIQYLIKEANPFRKGDIVIVPDGGEADGSMIEVAEKSILWTKFTVKGKQTHASTPERGINALRAGANLIVAMDELNRIFSQKDEIFEPPVSTFEPTKKEGNVPNVNTIPGEDIFYFDSRILPSVSIGEVKKKMEEFAKHVEEKFTVTVEVNYIQEIEAAPPTKADSEVVKVLIEAVEDVYKVKAKPMGIGGGTVAAYLRKAGIPSAVWAKMDETMHGPNEYVKISNILGDAKVFAHICCAR